MIPKMPCSVFVRIAAKNFVQDANQSLIINYTVRIGMRARYLFVSFF